MPHSIPISIPNRSAKGSADSVAQITVQLHADLDDLLALDKQFQVRTRPPSMDTLQRWFAALGDIQRLPNNSQQLFDSVASSLVSPGGLDAALVLKCDEQGCWKVVASCECSGRPASEDDATAQSATEGAGDETDSTEPDTHQSGALLGRLHQPAVVAAAAQHQRTAVVQCDPSTDQPSIVATPFYDETGGVAGVIYGVRAATKRNQRRHIRTSEIWWTRLVAEAVSAGLERFATEQREAYARLVFSRSFSPPVVKALQEDPDLLTPKECEIAVLFADLRGFTRLGAELGSELTCQILTDVMNRLTAQVMETDGVVLDYYGDGLAAMWNAPAQQPDFAIRACRTALRMQETMSQINHRWRDRIGVPLRLAIGIGSGRSLVGNAGSDARMKYGPRGTSVNLASRLESAAKKLDVPILICNTTQSRLPDSATTRRVCCAALPGIETPCQVHELHDLASPDRELAAMLDSYSEALELYEQGELDAACERLESLNDAARPLGGVRVLTRQTERCRSGEASAVTDIASL